MTPGEPTGSSSVSDTRKNISGIPISCDLESELTLVKREHGTHAKHNMIGDRGNMSQDLEVLGRIVTTSLTTSQINVNLRFF